MLFFYGKSSKVNIQLELNVWFCMGLSRYRVETVGASKPVSHMAVTKTAFFYSNLFYGTLSSPLFTGFLILLAM